MESGYLLPEARFIIHTAAILFVAYAGYALGKSDWQIHPMLTPVMVVVAVMLQGVWQLALPYEEIDVIARAVARSPQSPTLATVALVEIAGIWVPVLVIRWVALRTRVWAAAFIVGAGTFGAFAHYEGLHPPREARPEYEFWFALALIFAMVPFAIGCIVKRKSRLQKIVQATTRGQ
jgi:hypothetical protein